MRLKALNWLLLTHHAAANTYKYRGELLLPDVIQYRRVGMFAPKDAPSVGHPGDGTSSVSIDLRFQRSSPVHAGVVQVLVFNSAELPRLGAHLAGAADRSRCCTAALIARKVLGCRVAGQLIIADPSARRRLAHARRLSTTSKDQTMAKLPQASRSNVSERLSSWTSAPPTEKLPAPASNSSSSRKERTPSAKPTVAKPASSKPPASADTKPARHDELLILDVLFGANQTSASLSKRVLIRSSGVHYLVLSSCEPRTGAVAFSGRTVWKNPYGYLPAELFPFLPFFGQVALAYLVRVTLPLAILDPLAPCLLPCGSTLLALLHPPRGAWIESRIWSRPSASAGPTCAAAIGSTCCPCRWSSAGCSCSEWSRAPRGTLAAPDGHRMALSATE